MKAFLIAIIFACCVVITTQHMRIEELERQTSHTDLTHRCFSDEWCRLNTLVAEQEDNYRKHYDFCNDNRFWADCHKYAVKEINK